MALTAELRRFCLAHAHAFVVPAEMLAQRGVDPELAELLIGDGRLSPAQLRCLETGFRLYWQRGVDLYARAPGDWFPVRQTNLLIVENAGVASAYMRPFAGTSSLLYLSDLDAGAEYVAYLLVHMERLELARSMRAAVIINQSYWFDRDESSRTQFVEGAARADRPDRLGFVAVGNALGWVDELLHDPLQAPASEPDEPFVGVSGTGLYVPKRLQAQMMELADAAEAALHTALSFAAPPTSSSAAAMARPLTDLADWLADARAHVIVMGSDGAPVWSPKTGDASRIRRALSGASDAAIASVHADLRVIDERSRQFLGRVRDLECLPRHCAVLETGGGAYVDAARRTVVYELQQPGFDAQALEAPPYHRLLLGARVMHEWGHVAHAAKFLRVPEERRPAYSEARAALGERFARVVSAFPERLRSQTMEEVATIAARPADLPQALARKTLARVGDYLANLMSAQLIPGEEMQAYVRTNVRNHLDENLGLVSELARYAYEVHYLPLAALPRSYFFETSRFAACFIDTGIVSDKDAHALFDAAGAVLDCYAIDESNLRIDGRA